MTLILLHFDSKRYDFDLVRYKKSAHAETGAEITRENGSDAIVRLPALKKLAIREVRKSLLPEPQKPFISGVA